MCLTHSTHMTKSYTLDMTHNIIAGCMGAVVCSVLRMRHIPNNIGAQLPATSFESPSSEVFATEPDL